MKILIFLIFFIAFVAANEKNVWQVGVGKASLVPLVNGRNDYVVPLSPDDEQAGTFVAHFDNGIINIGNGNPDAHWVHDETFVRAAAIGPDADGYTALFVSSELYMLFKPDLVQFYARLEEAVGSERFSRLRVIVHAQHNHENADTGGVGIPINHKYYAFMIGQTVLACVEALDSAEAARIHWGLAPFYFGIGDKRDPLLEDNNVRVVRAFSADNSSRPLLTMAAWAFHPEVTLGYSPPFNQSNCTALPLGSLDCTAKGRYFSRDFPGWFSARMREIHGDIGEALYFNGAIGAQIGNHAPVWHVDQAHPLGNGEHVPPGATLIDKSFYKAYVIGTALANFSASIALSHQPLAYGTFDYRATEFYVRMTNFFFAVGSTPQRALSVLGSKNRPIFLGDTVRPAWQCDPIDAPSDANCVPVQDNAWTFDEITRLPYRIGTHMRSEVAYLRIGPLQWLTAPLELPPEIAVGLPSDFDTPEGLERYYNSPHLHATGANLTLPGVALQTIEQIDDEASMQILIGLGGDELGYAVELSDIRLVCSASQEQCEQLYQRGAMNYTGPKTFSMAGAQCMQVLDYPSVMKQRYIEQFDQDTWRIVNNTCVYGQRPDGYPSGHYEETNSGSLLLAQSYLNAVASLFGTEPKGRFCQGTYCAGVGRHRCDGCRN